MTRAPKATWTGRARADVPAKDTPVPCAVRTGAVAECAVATQEDRPVPGVLLIGVVTTSSTSVLSAPVVPACCAGDYRHDGR